MAIVEFDPVMDMDVRFGIARRVFTKTDTGTPRSARDVLTIDDVRQGARVSSSPS